MSAAGRVWQTAGKFFDWMIEADRPPKTTGTAMAHPGHAVFRCVLGRGAV